MRNVSAAVPAYLKTGMGVLNAEESVWLAMLDGWGAQQVSRNLSVGTVEHRRADVVRFRHYADAYPWSWNVAVVEEFFLELRALRGAAHTTMLGYQSSLRLFLEFLTNPGYGWGELCWERFGEHPAQVFHEWNTARHSQPAMGRTGKRPFTRDELQDLFDCADEKVMRIRASGSKGWIPAHRTATIMKTAYAWGLRRNEVRSLDLVDFARNPRAKQFGNYGIVYVRHGKAMRGCPPKRRSVLTLPEFDWVCEALKQWIDEVRPRIAAPGSTNVWPSERRTMLTADALSQAFTEVRREAGLDEGLDFHSLRRSYVTHLIEDGYDAFFVQQQVGHEHASTTSIYTGVSPDYRNRVVANAINSLAGSIMDRKEKS